MDSVEWKKVYVEAPLIQWTNGKEDQEEFIKLMKVYRKTNNLYDERFRSREGKVSELTELLERLETREYLARKKGESSADLAAYRSIVKANILLRRGQVKADALADPIGDYRTACAILEQIKAKDEKDLPYFLTQLNLGKYFRNMGMYLRQSDYYWRALDKFKNLLKQLSESAGSQVSPNLLKDSWKTYIWLEATINRSRTELYLYQLQEAKTHLWLMFFSIQPLLATKHALFSADIFYKLTKGQQEPGISELERAEILSEPESGKDPLCIKQLNQALRTLCLADSGLPKVDVGEKYRLSEEILNDYCIQAIIHLGIAYRKTRDYEIARKIFACVLTDDSSNVDALNNYAVCLRKSRFKIESLTDNEVNFLNDLGLTTSGNDAPIPAIMERLSSAIVTCICQGSCDTASIQNVYEKMHYSAEDILYDENHPLRKPIRNRFAMLELIRSFLKTNSASSNALNSLCEILDKHLEATPKDRELVLLNALLLQKQCKLEASQKLLHKLYLETPQIGRGTIGLKVQHIMGCNLLAQRRFGKARGHFKTIRQELVLSKQNSACTAMLNQFESSLHLKELPEIDVPAAINEAWCLMNLGEFAEAQTLYNNILEQYQDNHLSRLGSYNETMLRNNLVECMLEQLSSARQQKKKELNALYAQNNLNDVFSDDCNNEIQRRIQKELKAYVISHPLKVEIDANLGRLEELEYNNATAARHRGHFHLLKEEYPEAMEAFSESSTNRQNDVHTQSGWVYAAYARYYSGEKEKICKDLPAHLLYISGPYAVKSCAKLARIIEDMNTGDKTPLYRSLARIELHEREEGYSLFQELREDDTFINLDANQRGELLVILYQLYEKILEIKEHFRFYPENGKLPVQYRKLDHLKRYLKDATESAPAGRLSLWNTAYMNDYKEGEDFLVMLRKVEAQKDAKNSDTAKDVFIDDYFPPDDGSTQKDYLMQSEDVYTASLSLKEDDIPMWIIYADQAQGCTVTYSSDFLNLRKPSALPTDVSPYSDQDFPLYRVCYLDTDWYKKNELGDDQPDLQEMEKKLGEIYDLLKKFPSCAAYQKSDENAQEPKIKPVINRFVRSCLSEVRFLIKNREYKSEQEIRMIRYSREHCVETEHSEIPRLYIELDRDVELEEVVLGPKVDAFKQTELQVWLRNTGRVKKVSFSKRHYH